MAYNGFWADFLFNTGVVAAWCVFLWRVLDGPRFSWWGTALLTLVIDAAYLLPVLLLTTAGSALRLLLYPQKLMPLPRTSPPSHSPHPWQRLLSP